MTYCYRHLTAEDRVGHHDAATDSFNPVHCHSSGPCTVHRAPCTVSRELACHAVGPIKGYDAGFRVRLTWHRPRLRPKQHPDGGTFEVVVYAEVLKTSVGGPSTHLIAFHLELETTVFVLDPVAVATERQG